MKREFNGNAPTGTQPQVEAAFPETIHEEEEMFRKMALERYLQHMSYTQQNSENSSAVSHANNTAPSASARFQEVLKIGQGSFGDVFIVHDTVSGVYLTMKRMQLLHRPGERYKGLYNATARELFLLRCLKHENIVELVDYHIDASGALKMYMAVVAHDLGSLMRIWRHKGPRGEPSKGRMPLSTIKCLFHQLLSGLAYLHSKAIVHRDLKTSNVMIDEKGVLKIIDFGWSRYFPPKCPAKLTGPPCPISYRPPEVLITGKHKQSYDASIDIWCAALILFEMLSGGKQLINASSEAEAASAIVSLLGSPSSTSKLYYGTPQVDITFKKNLPRRLAHRCQLIHIDSDAVDILERMLQLEPADRATAASLLDHRWFTTPPALCLPSEISLPSTNTYRWAKS
ncbi:Protein kinase domain [Trypanosoma vivax]|uniref:Protein kinase domain-containing protein n=1 Tax=Trypanosoma vivax (strain Y486) TaxID=1055687 RepID=G0UBR9_TRYVY|nr:putative protein kinase [Trypanosoma vivax]KAH8609440.1 Protein kinase domain [Trypanosoma vivax]CCC53267.1 putative protein kinase [Trypanosoma vivax Y486]